MALCLAVAAGAWSLAANAADMLAHGRFKDVAVYRPAREVKQFVLLLSAEKGGSAALKDAALVLAREGAMVAAIDTAGLLASLEQDDAACTLPDGDLENLSRYVQAYYRLPTYITPILVGYGAGGTLAYAMLAQAPADLFAGAVSVQFCRTLALRRPLCSGTQLQFTPRADRAGVELAPATRLQVPWIAVQSATGSACSAPLTHEFLAAVPHAEEILRPASAQSEASGSSLPELRSAYLKVAAQRVPEAAPPASLADLPIVEAGAAGKGELFAIFLSGDGGWASIDKSVAAALVARGIAVAGLDSLRYFWTPRSAQGLAGDLDRMLRYYAFHWKSDRAVVMGYSQGADVLPFAINRLPAATRRRVTLVALLGLDERADFEFHLSNWVVNGASGLPVAPEIGKLSVPAVICIYGDDDADSWCPHLQPNRIKIVRLAGGHHFNGDYDAVAQVVVEAATGARAN